jgi:hypothetical protein
MTWGDYGTIVDTGQVTGALQTRLVDFLPAYLELVAQNSYTADPGKVAKPRSWEVVPMLDLSDEPQMPAIKIVSPGPTETPVSDGEGNLRATYEMNVVAIVTAKTESETTRLRDIYAAAIAACVMQKRSLNDVHVRGTDFGGNDHFDLPADERRTKQAVSVKFTIEYEHVANWKMGLGHVPIDRPDPDPIPQDPPVDPTAPPPIPVFVEVTNVSVDHE